MAINGGAAQSEAEAMAELARQLWERYIKPKATAELLSHSLVGYKATVEANNGDGTLTVSRPFDDTFMTLKCPPALAETAGAGDQVLVVALGNLSNAFVLCNTDLTGLGSGANLPTGGQTGDLLSKKTSADGDAEWITPASSAEADNTRPITSAAVYTEIGDINSLLATI